MAILTNAGLALIAAKQAAEQNLNVDQFVLANINGLDHETTPPGTEAMPDPGDIVYQAAVTQAGYVDPNTVVYSLLMSTATGDFDFNWIGLYSSVDDVLVAVTYVPLQTKKKTTGGLMGNTLTKNFAIEYSNYTDVSGVVIEADTWQLDITSRVKQIDERERLSNFDLYGTKYFFDTGFQVIDTGGNVYEVSAGLCYIDGIRLEESVATPVGDPGTLPTDIYVDAVLDGDLTGRIASWSLQISQTTVNHYVDGTNQQHYVERIATINADGSITDRRGDGTGGKIRQLDSDVANAIALATQNDDLTSGIWVLDSNTAKAHPADGKVRFNDATLENITEMYFDYLNKDGIDQQSLFNLLGRDHTIYWEEEDNNVNSARFTIDSVVDETGYFTFGVTIDDSEGAIPADGSDIYVGFSFTKRGMEVIEERKITAPTAIAEINVPSGYRKLDLTVNVSLPNNTAAYDFLWMELKIDGVWRTADYHSTVQYNSSNLYGAEIYDKIYLAYANRYSPAHFFSEMSINNSNLNKSGHGHQTGGDDQNYICGGITNFIYHGDDSDLEIEAIRVFGNDDMQDGYILLKGEK